jgi:hypothetical protein
MDYHGSDEELAAFRRNSIQKRTERELEIAITAFGTY